MKTVDIKGKKYIEVNERLKYFRTEERFKDYSLESEVIELAFDANHIHMFDGETEASILERDEGYEVIEENAEGSAFVPPTPQEMRDQIAAARSVTKEMKAQMRKDERMARLQAKQAAKTQKTEEVAEESEDKIYVTIEYKDKLV